MQDLRKKIVVMGVRMVEEGLTHGTCGNISCRIPNQLKMLITPSSIPYHHIQPEDILVVDGEGNVEGEKNPSVETPLHLAIYKNRDDVNAVVHTHSLYALAVSTSPKGIPVFIDEIFASIGGTLDVAEYALPGSEELAENVIRTIKDKNAILLSSHGAVCCGKNLDKAFETAETVEKICEIFVLSSIVGKVNSLSDDGVEYQRAMFEMKKEFDV